MGMRARASRRVFLLLWLGLGPALAWAAVLHTSLSGDVFWQWQAGRLMLARHHVLASDPFSYTLYRHPWVTEEWGFEVTLAALVQAIGPVTFWLIPAGAVSIAIIVTAWRIRARGAAWAKVAFLVGAASLALPVFVKARPQVFSYLFFSLLLWLLETARRRPKMIWWVIPLLWVWTNMHGSFLLGFSLVALEWVTTRFAVFWGRLGPPATRVDPAVLLRVLAASVLLSFVNPNGPGLWVYAAHVAFSAEIARLIAEWQSPNFHSWWMVANIAGPLVALAVATVVSDRRMSWPDFLLTGGLFLETLRSVRFLPYFALEWPVLASDLLPDMAFRRVSGWIGAPVMAAALALILAGHPTVAAGTVSPAEPVGAADYLLRHPGRVFNAYHWGGYLIYRHIPVFVDGRTDFYLQSRVLEQYIAVKTLAQNPAPVWRAYRVRYIVWPPRTPLAVYLQNDSRHWRLVYQSPAALVFRHIGNWPAPRPRGR